MSQETQSQLREAHLQDVPVSALAEAVPDLRARNSVHCDAEYGIRTDDGALIMHFYPPGYAAATDETIVLWPKWQAFHDRLEAALLSSFPRESIRAGYTEELVSFWAVISPIVAPDQVAAIETFFRALEA